MALDICRRLKLDQIIYRTQEPDPDAETAWSYVKTYFDECTETAFGVIQRPNFEARLRSQFKQGQLATADQDPAWYALRNIVYAGGCRQLSGKSAFNGFRFDEGLAWKFFSNAFSVYQELLYCRTNLLAVQALVAMVPFVLYCPDESFLPLTDYKELLCGGDRHPFARIHAMRECFEIGRIQRPSSPTQQRMESE